MSGAAAFLAVQRILEIADSNFIAAMTAKYESKAANMEALDRTMGKVMFFLAVASSMLVAIGTIVFKAPIAPRPQRTGSCARRQRSRERERPTPRVPQAGCRANLKI